MSDKKMVKITVNGDEHEVEAGRWLIDVLNDLGNDIPHFCYHPGLGPDGNCRMCQVEYLSDRGARLAISCNQPVVDGLNIATHSERVKKARAGVEESLLLNHPLDCPICDKAGECTLQNYYMEYDLQNTKQEFARFKKNKAKDIGPTLMLDQERCVLCDRCVRFLRDYAGEEQLYIAGRGHEAELTPFPGKPVDSPYSLNTYDLCPVGALTSKDFRFSVAPWFLKRTPSTCTTCSRGCATTVDTWDGKVYRMRPRHNADVNGYWMCDEGRLNYKFVNEERLRDALLRRDGGMIADSFDNGLNELASVLGIGNGAGKEVVVVVSATATLEEMFALKKLVAAMANAKLYAARHVADGVEDDKLRRGDRHPNVRGAETLGIEVIDLRDGAGGTGIQGDVLLSVGFDYGFSQMLENFYNKFNTIGMIASRVSKLTEMAQVVIPGLTFAEKDGLLINFEGHIQKLIPTMDNLWDRTPPWAVIVALTAMITGEGRAEAISGVRTAIGNDEAAFAGVNLNEVGDTGVRLQGQAV